MIKNSSILFAGLDMYLKKISVLKNRLVFRLTFLYALLFIASSIAVLSIFFQRVSTITMERMDKELLEELDELAAEKELKAIIEEILQEVESEYEEEVFYRLLTLEGKIIGEWNAGPFESSNIENNILNHLKKDGAPIFRTIKSSNQDHKFRAIFAVVLPSTVLQIGLSLGENEEFLSLFKRLIVLLIFPLCFFSGCVGWILAKKALKGVAEVTQTAMDISDGSFDERVQVKNHSTEIDNLARVFNKMVDRLQATLSSMREMNNNIAHDFRSPLARIRGIAEMTIMNKQSTREANDLAGSIIEECDRLINIVNTMMEISESEVGLGELKPDNIRLDAIVSDAVDLFDQIATEKHITISTNIPNDCQLKADKNKLQRVLTNLLENAIKYTPEGGIINISAGYNGDKIIIEFEDTGIGIPEKDLSKIFNRFYRCDESRSEEGIGLGLCLVKAIVEELGGTIKATSQLGKGSIFTVVIPQHVDNKSQHI